MRLIKTFSTISSIGMIYCTKLLIFLAVFLFSRVSLGDMQIIENGSILVKKLYSSEEETVVVNNSDKIYVCSIVNKKSKCILSDYKID